MLRFNTFEAWKGAGLAEQPDYDRPKMWAVTVVPLEHPPTNPPCRIYYLARTAVATVLPELVSVTAVVKKRVYDSG